MSIHSIPFWVLLQQQMIAVAVVTTGTPKHVQIVYTFAPNNSSQIIAASILGHGGRAVLHGPIVLPDSQPTAVTKR